MSNKELIKVSTQRVKGFELPRQGWTIPSREEELYTDDVEIKRKLEM